jgi:hypothetical protein
MRGKPIDQRWLSNHLRDYGIATHSARIEGRVVKAYNRADLADAWDRYLPSVGAEATLSEGRTGTSVAAVAAVAVSQGMGEAAALRLCDHCGEPVPPGIVRHPECRKQYEAQRRAGRGHSAPNG